MLRKKSAVTRTGIDPGTFRLVAYRLNHYATPGPDMTNAYRILTGMHDGNRKVRGLKGKNGGDMRREREIEYVCCRRDELDDWIKWLVVVNTRAETYVHTRGQGMLLAC